MKRQKSPLRYPGGKSKALDKILPHIPLNIAEFREPFVGGGSVYLAARGLLDGHVQHYWINDLNYDLFCFWQQLRDDPAALLAAIQAVRETFPSGRALYLHFKDETVERSDFERAVRFFVMNRITFSGVADAGGYSQQAFERRFTDSSVARLQSIVPLLRKTRITYGDYQPVVEAAGESVFLFLDPPYFSATHSRLYGVRGNLHTAFDHERFAHVMRGCTRHRWLITYDDDPHVRTLFHFATIVAWELQYGMNNYKQPTAAKGKELFIKNY